MKNVLGMSVVGRDYDELKQYNLAEIYDPKPTLANTSNGAAPEVMVKDDTLPSNVAANELGPEDAVIPRLKGEDDKTSLDFQEAADNVHLTTAVSDG